MVDNVHVSGEQQSERAGTELQTPKNGKPGTLVAANGFVNWQSGSCLTGNQFTPDEMGSNSFSGSKLRQSSCILFYFF